MITILTILVVNWALLFTIPYIVAFFALRSSEHIISKGVHRYVLYISFSGQSKFKKWIRAKFSKHAMNFSFGPIIYFDASWFSTEDWSENETFKRLERHERRHVMQQLWFGALQWLLYGILYLFVGYQKNWFEIDARNQE